MAIANPSQDILVGAAFASDLLLNKEDSDIRYIEFSGQAKERREEADAKKEARFGKACRHLKAAL